MLQGIIFECRDLTMLFYCWALNQKVKLITTISLYYCICYSRSKLLLSVVKQCVLFLIPS